MDVHQNNVTWLCWLVDVGEWREVWDRETCCEHICFMFPFRIQEQLLFKRLMACHSLAKEQLKHPISLNEGYVQ